MSELQPNTYNRFAGVYNEASLSLAQETWRKGILKTLQGVDLAGKSILDLGCGTGIGGRLIRDLGCGQLVGLDQSLHMLRQATPYYDEIILADFANLPAPNACFDYVISGFDSLNYLSRSQLSGTFKHCATYLAHRGGRIIFDYSSPTLLKKYWANARYEQILDLNRVLSWWHRFDDLAGHSITTVSLLYDKAVRWTERHVQFSLGLKEMRDVVAQAGLQIIEVRDLDLCSYSDEAHTHVFELAQIPSTTPSKI